MADAISQARTAKSATFRCANQFHSALLLTMLTRLIAMPACIPKLSLTRSTHCTCRATAWGCTLTRKKKKLQLRRNELLCLISDTGLPMPEGQLPAGVLAPLGDFADLPEGGFGWHLIRSLSKDLSYRREGGRNLLSFRLDTQQSPA